MVTSRDSITTFAILGNGDLQFLAENDLIIPGITHANALSVHTQTFAPDFHVYVSTTPNPDVFVPPGEVPPIGNPEVRGFDLDPATGTLSEFGGVATGFEPILGDPPHFAAAMTNVGNRFLVLMNSDFAGDQDDAISVFSFDLDGNLTLVTLPPVTFGGDSGLVKNFNGTNSLFVPDQQGEGVFNIRLDQFGTPSVFAPPAQTVNSRYVTLPAPPTSLALNSTVLAVVSDLSLGAVLQSFSLNNFGLALPMVIVPPAKSTFGAFPAFGQGYNIAHYLANDGGSQFVAMAGSNLTGDGNAAGELRIMKALNTGQLQLIFPKKVQNNFPQIANPFIRPLGFGFNASGLVSIKP